MLSLLSKNILQTIIYYDIFNFPLTSFEIWKYLIAEKSFALGEVVEKLDSEELKGKIEGYRGFYFLAGRKELVGRRIQNDKNSVAKFKIAEKATKWLRFVPFVRMIAVTGTLAMKNCEKDSDIDLFVVLEKGRIFTGRLLVTGLVHLLRKRRYGKKIKNRICLNYFVATDRLEIQRKDLFAANEYSFIYPIFDSFTTPIESQVSEADQDGKRRIRADKKIASHKNINKDSLTLFGVTKESASVFNQFCKANFEWIKKFKPNWEIPKLVPAKYFIEDSACRRAVQKFFENLINFLGGDRIEAWLKAKQIAWIECNPLTVKEGAYIEATDQNLIFLPEPQGGRIEEEWQRRINS